MKPFLCIGHRGAAGLEPENTLRSIRRAMELGAGGVEVDVHLSRDGVLMVIHDASLRRTTGFPGQVREMSFDQLRLLDAGKGERIPTLREVLDEMEQFQREHGRRLWLNIELKGRQTALSVEREIIAAVARGCWQFEDFTVSSFRYRELAALSHPEVQVGLLIRREPLRLLPLLLRFRATSLHLARRLATPRFLRRVEKIRAALAARLPVYVYTVNAPDVMERLRQLGVAGVFTDYPDRCPSIERSLKGGA